MVYAARCSTALCRSARRRPQLSLLWRPQQLSCPFHQSCVHRHEASTRPTRREKLLETWTKYCAPDTPVETGCRDAYVGFIGKRRNVSKHLSFADLTTPSGEIVQICSKAEDDAEAHAKFRQVAAHSPVLVHGSPEAAAPSVSTPSSVPSKPMVYLQDIRLLNSFPSQLIVTPEVVFPPSKRHLQIRFHPELQARLRFRSWLKGVLSQDLLNRGFTDIETPTLFKSTPEGAQEFLVPTQTGRAYALSQSPQQYKQALMASGITRYMQWARCYRDEGMRADRQPEFSQLDMEWAFAGAATVMQDVTDMISGALSALRPACSYQDIRGERIPVVSELTNSPATADEPDAHEFTTLTFAEAIAAYGSDKPDLRIPGRIHAIADNGPIHDFVGMITHMSDPLVEATAFSLSDCSPAMVQQFVTTFMDNLPPSLGKNPDGKPQILIYDSSKPLCGFSSMGFAYEEILGQVSGGKELQDGDLVIFQARERPAGQYCASSTKLGELRAALWRALVDAGYMTTPALGEPYSLQFAWVTEFPMFKPVEDDEPGQGGAAGITAAHHPFTAPLSQADLETLFTNPLEARSAAYDLVLNGVEIGGGSQRNHIADIQDFIMRDVLKMPDERIAQFSHLFDALRAGCPPHAGFALGFDRLVALMTGTATVRDVMAFPKTMKGEDLFVKSPGKLNNEFLAPYGLQIRSKKA